MKKVGNYQKNLKAEYQVLSGLASSNSALGFNELKEKTSVSSRTLAKHLKTLVPKNIQKEGEKYRITDVGRQLVANIKQDPEIWTKKGESRQSYVETVEVYSIGPKHFSKGTMKVTSTRKLLSWEREKLDRGVTYAIRKFSSVVPEGSTNWRVSIYSHISLKP